MSAALAVGLFLSREAGRAMDAFARGLGLLMVALTAWVAVSSQPPLGEAARRAIVPERIDVLAIVTLVGGTVGGYITFAGAHRLLDAGISGPARMRDVTTAASRAIGIASFMRVVLFLAALGVVAGGATLDAANPPASVFRLALGEVGFRLFGVVMWAAAITSVVGAAYTSVTFLRSLHPSIAAHWRRWIIGFIVASTLVFLLIGRPVRTLVMVGALNALVLPLGLTVMLVAARRPAIVGGYRHPLALTLLGWAVALVMAALGVWTLARELPRLWG